MDNQNQFLDKLRDVVTLAKINQMEVTKEFIKDYFTEMDIDEEKINYIYEYLIQENVKVKGYKENQKVFKEAFSLKEPDEEESEYLGSYLDEISQKYGKHVVSKDLYEKVKQGDLHAKNTIIERKLERVTVLAGELKNNGLSQSDLIQEGNVGLLIALEHIKEKDDLMNEDEYVDNQIRNAMLRAIDEFREDKKISSNVIGKAERLKSEIENLAEDFGDKMTTEDIAQFTGMDLEEIKDILRITGEEL